MNIQVPINVQGAANNPPGEAETLLAEMHASGTRELSDFIDAIESADANIEQATNEIDGIVEDMNTVLSDAALPGQDGEEAQRILEDILNEEALEEEFEEKEA